MYFLLSGCENPTVLQIIYFCKIIVQIICIAVPIALIVMLVIDFSKNVMAGNDDEQKKNVKLAIKRIIYAIAIFLVPTFISLVMHMLADTGITVGDCSNNATSEKIQEYKELQTAEDEAYVKQQKDKKYSVEESKTKITKTENNSNTTDNSNSSSNSSTTTNNGCTYIDGILIVNKTYSIPKDYKPKDPYKSVGSSKRCNDCLEKEVYKAFNDMSADAKAAGIDLSIVSGYRSYNCQEEIYNSNVKNKGQNHADKYSAKAGHSEHQTGLSFDVNSIETSFANTAEGKWVNQNCYLYGFVIRYPKEKESITGYAFEPWHLRYVGKDLAKKLYNGGSWITLEEHFNITSSQ